MGSPADKSINKAIKLQQARMCGTVRIYDNNTARPRRFKDFVCANTLFASWSGFGNGLVTDMVYANASIAVGSPGNKTTPVLKAYLFDTNMLLFSLYNMPLYFDRVHLSGLSNTPWPGYGYGFTVQVRKHFMMH